MYTNIDEFCEYYGLCKYSECGVDKARFLRMALNKTDWVVVRCQEQGTELPSNFAKIRQDIRNEIELQESGDVIN